QRELRLLVASRPENPRASAVGVLRRCRVLGSWAARNSAVLDPLTVHGLYFTIPLEVVRLTRLVARQETCRRIGTRTVLTDKGSTRYVDSSPAPLFDRRPGRVATHRVLGHRSGSGWPQAVDAEVSRRPRL